MTDKKLFIAMPYGTRVDKLDHYDNNSKKISLNFDKIWQGVIQPAIPIEYGYKRADELRQPGIIDKLYIEWLFNADVVIADLTFENPNVYYELGMRHVFSKKGTVLVAQAGSILPFDVRNQYVLYYDYFEAPSLPKFHKELYDAINNSYQQNEDSPVHILLPGLTLYKSDDKENLIDKIKNLQQEKNTLLESLNKFKTDYEGERYLDKVKNTSDKIKLIAYYNQILKKSFNSVVLYETLGIKLRKMGLILEAINTFKVAIEKIGDDADLFRELGFSYRKLGDTYFSEAEGYFYKALSINDQDPELLGMLGGMHKRKGNFEDAKLFYEKANSIVPNDIYSLVNLGFIQLILQDSKKSKINYQKIIDITTEKIKRNDVDYWDYLTRGQALLFLTDIETSIKSYEEAIKLTPPIEDLKSEYEQLELLKINNIEIKKIADIQSVLIKALNNKH